MQLGRRSRLRSLRLRLKLQNIWRNSWGWLRVGFSAAIQAAGIIWNSVWEGIRDGFQAFVNPIKTALNGLLSLVARVKSAIRSIPRIPNPLGVLPGFASGVTNFRGGAAIVGERGPELVNLPRGSSVIPQLRRLVICKRAVPSTTSTSTVA